MNRWDRSGLRSSVSSTRIAGRGSRWSTVRTSTVWHRNCSVPWYEFLNIFVAKRVPRFNPALVALAPAVYGGSTSTPGAVVETDRLAGARDLGDARDAGSPTVTCGVDDGGSSFGCWRAIFRHMAAWSFRVWPPASVGQGTSQRTTAGGELTGRSTPSATSVVRPDSVETGRNAERGGFFADCPWRGLPPAADGFRCQGISGSDSFPAATDHDVMVVGRQSGSAAVVVGAIPICRPRSAGIAADGRKPMRPPGRCGRLSGMSFVVVIAAGVIG